MKQKRRDIKISGAVRDLHHLRLMALLLELVRLRGISGTAQVLEIYPRTVASSVQSDQLTRRVRDSLQRALQHGIGSAGDRQRERNDKLEAQLKEMKENLRSGLKGLRMSLDGVRKYYGVQRRLIEQRLLALEAGPEGTETGVATDGESRAPESSSVPTSALHPREFKDPTLAESLDAEERLGRPDARQVQN